MTKTLTRHGNSYALILDRPILELLKIGLDTPLELSTDGKVLLVAPVRKDKRDRGFQAGIEWANRHYGRALQKLAGRTQSKRRSG